MAESPKDQSGSGSPQKGGPSFALLMASPVAGVLFGSGAFDLGARLVCLISAGTCSALSRAEGGMVAVALGFAIITAVGSEVARRKGTGADAVVSGATVALIAGVYSAFKALPDINYLPDPKTVQFVFFALVAVAMFALPSLVRPYAKNRWTEIADLYGRMAIASLIAGVATLLIQGVPRLLADGMIAGAGVNFYTPSHPSFLLVRPATIGLIIAPWIILSLDPIIDPRAWLASPRSEVISWLVCYTLLAIVLAACFVYFFYWPDHHDNDWVKRAHIGLAGTMTIFFLLLLAPLAGAFVHVAFKGGARRWSTYLAAVVGVAGSVVVGLVLWLRIGVAIVPAIIFTIIHMISAIVTLVTGLVVARYRKASGP